MDSISDLDADFVGQQIDTVIEDFDLEWAKTGMLSNEDIIDAVIDRVQEHGVKLVVDPVMATSSGSSLLQKGALPALKDLLREAKVVTPNIDEANKLADMKVGDLGQMRDAAEEILALGVENVVIKGGHMDTSEVHNLLLHGNEFIEFETERVPASRVHGTGCVFSAGITAELAKGRDLPSAVKKTGDFMINAIDRRLSLGEGNDIVNPLCRNWKLPTGEGEEIEEVQKAVQKLVDLPGFEKLIPEVGTNIAMAPMNAQRREDVVGLTGRIVKSEGRPYLSGYPAPGGSEHVANIVLTMMKHNPKYRSAMNIKFSEKILEKCRDLGLDTSEFNREEEPSDSKTMKWGTEKAIENVGGMPDIIYDKGAVGKEPMIRILGEKASEISEKVEDIVKELGK